jgi:hypothetical protein
MNAVVKVVAFNSVLYDVLSAKAPTVHDATEEVLEQLDLKGDASLFTIALITNSQLAAAGGAGLVLATDGALVAKDKPFLETVTEHDGVARGLLLKRQVFHLTDADSSPKLVELTAMQVATDVKHGLYPEPADTQHLHELIAAGDFAGVLDLAAGWPTGKRVYVF